MNHHAQCKVGDTLADPFYFAPPKSLWAEVMHRGTVFRFERARVGAHWIRTR
jgi:hypothetical protein